MGVYSSIVVAVVVVAVYGVHGIHGTVITNIDAIVVDRHQHIDIDIVVIINIVKTNITTININNTTININNHKRQSIEIRLGIRRTSSPKLGALDLGPNHLESLERFPPEEHFMIIRPRIRPVRNPFKIIQIQLPPKRRNLGLIEETFHDHRFKILGFPHGKGSAVGLPGYDILHAEFVNEIEEGLEFEREGAGDLIVLVQVEEVAVGLGGGFVDFFGAVDVLVLDVLSLFSLGG